MQQGTSTIPARGSFDRLTANAYWIPLGTSDGSMIDLGVIDMSVLDEGIAREKVPFAVDRGAVVLGWDEVVSVAPIFQLKGKQFFDKILPLLYMGSSAGALIQSNVLGATRTVIAALGKEFDLGPAGIQSVVVTDGGSTTYTAGVDYFIYPGRGTIRFPQVAAGIADGQSVLVTFNRPSLTRNGYTAFNNLNQSGTLLLFEIGDIISYPTFEASMPGTLSRDKGSSGDPMKSDQWALRFALEGEPVILRPADDSYFLFDDGSRMIIA